MGSFPYHLWWGYFLDSLIADCYEWWDVLSELRSCWKFAVVFVLSPTTDRSYSCEYSLFICLESVIELVMFPLHIAGSQPRIPLSASPSLPLPLTLCRCLSHSLSASPSVPPRLPLYPSPRLPLSPSQLSRRSQHAHYKWIAFLNIFRIWGGRTQRGSLSIKSTNTVEPKDHVWSAHSLWYDRGLNQRGNLKPTYPALLARRGTTLSSPLNRVVTFTNGRRLNNWSGSYYHVLCNAISGALAE